MSPAPSTPPTPGPASPPGPPSSPPPAGLPLVLVAEDGDEYTARFSRLLGSSFRFARAGSFAEVAAALTAGAPGASGAARPVAALVLDLDFRRTPPCALVDERGLPAAAAEAPRLAAVQGILILRALRARGATVPALLCADLDDPEQERTLCRELGPLQISPSSESLPAVVARLRALGAGPSAGG